MGSIVTNPPNPSAEASKQASPEDSKQAPNANRSRRSYRYLRQVFGFARPYPWHIAGAVVGLVTAAGAMLAFGAGLQWLVDHGFRKGGAGLLDAALLGLLAIVVLLAAATFTRAYLVTWLGERIAADLRKAVYGNVIRLSPAWFETNPTGEVLSRLTTDTTLLQQIVATSVSMALRNLLMMAGGIAMMAITSPRLTGLSLLIVPAVVLPLMVFGRRVRRLSRASQDRIGDVGAHIDETLNALPTIQSFSREQDTTRRFEDEVEGAFRTAARRVLARASLTACIILLVFTAIGLLLWTGGQDMVAGDITPGELSAFVFYAVLVAAAVGVLGEFAADLQRAAGASERLIELLDVNSDIQAPAQPTALPEPGEGRIAFTGVTFAYPSHLERNVLSDFSLAVAPGETVALVGPSGAGKTTVFQLLLRFYDVQAGAVTLDGIDVRQAEPGLLRERMALVAQEPVIFTGTVTDNIRFGRLDAGDEHVRAAAEAAAADEFVSALANGYDTHLGEKGVRLSGGQRQRLAIARAIIRDPSILLLDEATSALDAESEKLVQGALDRAMAGRTTLIIAHRLATVLKADRIVVMDEGRIVAQGRHQELIAQGGLYGRLAELQFDMTGGAASAA